MSLRRSRFSFLLLVGLGVACGLAVTYRTTLIRYFNHCAASIMYPLLCIQRPVVATLHGLTMHRATTEQLRERVQQLEVENQHLRANLVRAYAAQETALLADVFERCLERYTYTNALPARIILKQLDDHEHSFFIDAGSHVGVEKDMVVVVDRNLVGKVTDVYPWYSKVMSVTDRRCNVACYCVTTGTVGIHEGVNDTHRTAVTHVEHVAIIHSGDYVLSSGKGLVFPAGFCLGKVASIAHDGLWHTLTVDPLVDIEQLDYCMVFHAGQRPEASS